MTGEQALNALAERVAAMRAMTRRAGYQRRDEGDEPGYERAVIEGEALTRVLGEIQELRKKL